MIQELERAPLGVVGVVRDRRALDASAWEAEVAVERILVAPEEAAQTSGATGVQPTVTVVWEELAASRAPRLDEGERVLLVLGPVPDGSLWARRVPAGRRDVVWHLAGRGEAFVREPSLAAVDMLDHYLRLAPEARRDAPGSLRLASLVAQAEPPLAESAAAALADPLRDPGGLSGEAADLVVEGLLRPEPALRDALLELVARHPSPGLSEALERRVAAETPPAAVLVAALGRARGALPSPMTKALLDDADPSRRAAAARHAGSGAAEDLARLAVTDPAPEVRAAAAERLLELKGVEGLDAALEALGDPDADVRHRAARALAEVGPEAVARLADVARRWPSPAPQAAILALSFRPRAEVLPVLEELADTHPDPAVRRLAALALGRDVGHSHGGP